MMHICSGRSSYFKIEVKYPVAAFNDFCSGEACVSYYCVAAFPEHMLNCSFAKQNIFTSVN